MAPNKNHATSKNSNDHYWERLIENFSSHSRIWLEDFETDKKQYQHTYFKKNVILGKDREHAIKAFCVAKKIPIFYFINAAWALLLNRYTTSDDIIYGISQFSYDPASQKIDGTFPVLPVRSKIHENETIMDHLKQLKKELKANIKKSPSYSYFLEKNDLFQHIFNYLFLYSEKTVPKNHQQSIDYETQKVDVSPERFPLVFVFGNKSPMDIKLLCNEARFTEESAESLSEHFKVIIDKIIEDEDQNVAHYSILTQLEKQELLKGSRLKRSMLSKSENLSVHDLFNLQVKKTPNYIAIVHGEMIYTYKQLGDISNQIAHLLIQKNIRRGDIVNVLMERSPILIAAMLAVFKVGGIFAPIDPKYTDENIEFVLNDCNSHLILVNNTRRLPKDTLYKSVIIDNNLAALKKFPEQFPISKLSHADQLAYLIHTSGTTGQPKGVLIRHESLVNLINWYKICFSITAKDRSSQFSSQGFDKFFTEVVPFITIGASVHIVDDQIKFNPNEFFSWLDSQKITFCDLPTAYAQVLFNGPWSEKSSLRILKLGGETLTHYPKRFFPFDIWNTYGPTEATIESTYMKIYQANSSPEKGKKKRHFLPPIGKPLPNCELFVVDQHTELAPIGSAGELLIGGINVASGYYHRQPLTDSKFIRNPFSQDPTSRLYRTGDLVRWLKDGNLEFIGRIDHQAKISGYRVDLNEIEIALSQYPDINEVVVLDKKWANGQNTLIAYLVPNLDRIRIPYQEKCLIAYDENHYLQALTEDISKAGVALTGSTDELKPWQDVRVNFKLPGSNEGKWLTGKVVWQSAQRAGIHFDQTELQIALLQKSIQYYLTTHNLMETLETSAAKRSLRSALKKKFPAEMIPAMFCTLPHLPLTFNGKVDWRSLPPPREFERILDRNFVEPRNKTEKNLHAIWQEILNQEKISMTDNFFDLGGNSHLAAQLSVKILQKFKLALPEKILFDLPFIPVMAEYIDTQGKEYAFKVTQQDDIQRDAILNDDIMPNKKCSVHLANPEGILLTGVSGFLGVFLLKELLDQTDAKIYCLIRKGKFESVAERLLSNIERYELGSLLSLANRRIVMIPGDMGHDQFGVPLELYNNLASKIDLIYHCGAQVNSVTSYSNLRTSNVQGTLEIIKFALRQFDKPVHYVSMLATANRLSEEGHLVEEFPDANASQITGGYTTSKWISERLLTQAKNRGLPVSIYRSGYIWGQSDSGVTNVNDALLFLIKGCIQLGLAPDWNEKITILPVNFVSKIIVGISLQQKDKSDVFHIDHPTGMMWTDLIAWLNHYGYSIKTISHTEWLQKLAEIQTENALYPFLPHLLSQTEPPDSPVIDMDNTINALTKIQLTYPEINNRLLSIYIRYLCEVGFLPEPENKRKQIFV